MNQKRKIGKRIAAWLLCIVMVFSSVNLPDCTLTAFAEETDIQNVSIDEDGTMTWDAFPGAAAYYLRIASGFAIVKETSFDLNQFLGEISKPSGTYELKLYARDDSGGQISTTYSVNYSYVTTTPQLAAPTNFVCDGTVISWEPVENATSYFVVVYKNRLSGFDIGRNTVYESSIDIANYLDVGTYNYGISVYAQADGYLHGETARSDLYSMTKVLPAITGVSIAEDGTMTWDAFPGTDYYVVSLNNSSTKVTSDTSADLDEILKSHGKPSGEYTVSLSASDRSGKQISGYWTGTYTYTAPEPLEAPSNFVWNDRTVSWDPVTNATSYRVLLYREKFFSPVDQFEITTTSFEIPRKYLKEGTIGYGVSVRALSDEYPSSEHGSSELHEITYLKPSIQNAKITGGVLSWDALAGAKDYIVDIEDDDISVKYTSETSFDVDGVLRSYTKPGGKYSVKLSARDQDGAVFSIVTTINYQYVIMYAVSVTSADEKGSVSGSGRYEEGSTVTIKAYPAANYLFEKWTDENGAIIDGAGKEYTFVVDSTSGLQYVAWFVPCVHEYAAEDDLGHRCSICGRRSTHYYVGQPYTAIGNGKHVQVCDSCDQTREGSCTAGGETVENRVNPTCGLAGSYDIVTYCVDCNQELTRETKETAATGTHRYTGQPYQTDDAGKHYQKCIVCGGESEHEVCRPRNAVKEDIVPPTCGVDGSHNDVVYCAVCNQTLSTTPVTDPATGVHKNRETRDAVSAGCATEGYTGNTYCIDCGNKIGEGSVIEATGEHEFSQNVTNEDGTTKVVCKGCGIDKPGPDIQNVSIAEDGTMTWDAYLGAKTYDLDISNWGGTIYETGCNLDELLEKHGFPSGTYEVRLFARDSSGIRISATYITYYSYVAKKPQLALPTNFVWNGTTVSWDSVAGATGYEVYVYRDCFEDGHRYAREVDTNSIDLADFLYEGTYDYGVRVVARANGYPNSDWGESDFQSIVNEHSPMTGVDISAEGIMTWDAYEGAKTYSLGVANGGGFFEGTSYNLAQRLENEGKPSGIYEIRLYARDDRGKQISATYITNYSYVAKKAQLAAPTNLVWNNQTVTWDSVPDATSYNVYLYMGGYLNTPVGITTTNETSYEIPRKYLYEGTNYYGVRVSAVAEGYPSSEFVESKWCEVSYIVSSIKNVNINDGVLSWNALAGAKDYIIDIREDDIDVIYTEETSFDIDAVLVENAKPNGTYSIVLSARNAEGNVISTTIMTNYQYMMKHDISVKSSNRNGTVSGSGKYREGSTVTIIAEPKVGYIFDGWTDQWGNKIDDAGKEYSFVVDPLGSLQYVASFIPCETHHYVIIENPTVLADRTKHQCSLCGYKELHSYGPYVENGKGKHIQSCTSCETIRSLNCRAGETFEENKVEPTCITAGSYDEVTYCLDCKQEYERVTKEIAATGVHDFSEEGNAEKCSVCGIKNINFSGLDSSVVSEDTEYTGSELTSAVSITGLVKDADYTLTDLTKTEVGTYTITVTGEGDYAGVREVNWNIVAGKPVLQAPKLTATFGDILLNVSLTGKNPASNVAGTWTWKDASVSVGEVGTHTFKANFAPTDTTHWYGVEDVDVEVTVGKAVYSGAEEYSKSYLYSKEYEESINLTQFVPEGAGEVSFEVEKSATGTDTVGTVSVEGTDLQFAVNKMEAFAENTATTISITVKSANYKDFVQVIKVTRTDCEHPAEMIVTEHPTPATCEEKGVDLRRCNQCGEVVESGIVTNALGHNYVNGKCTGCEVVSLKLSGDINITAEKLKYDGNNHKPSVTVSYKGVELMVDTDYTIAVDSQREVGNYELVITGINQYRDSVTVPWSITANEGLWYDAIPAMQYTGKALKPILTVYYGDEVLSPGKDYTLSYKNNTNATTADKPATITVKGKGNFAGSTTATFEIKKVDITDLVLPSDLQMVYTGKVLKPSVNITYQGKALKLGKEYEIRVKDNEEVKAAKTYDVVIAGLGNFTGEVNTTLTVADIKSADKFVVSKITKQNYNDGNVIEPEFTVKYGKDTLTKGNDYEVAYKNNTKVGIATIVITGKNDYVGTKLVNFEIVGTAISKAKVTGLDDMDYTGKAITLSNLKLMVGDKTLTEGTDYMVSYDNNVLAGKGNVTITGKNGYVGTIKKTFKIKPYAVVTGDTKVTASALNMPLVKGGSKSVVTVTFDGKQLVEGVDFTVSYKNNKAVTTDAIATVKFKGNLSGTMDCKYSITAADPSATISISGAKATVATVEYDGTAKTPKLSSITIGKEKTSLTEGVDYKIIGYAKNVNKGTATVTIQGIGKYYGTKVVSFKIGTTKFEWWSNLTGLFL